MHRLQLALLLLALGILIVLVNQPELLARLAQSAKRAVDSSPIPPPTILRGSSLVTAMVATAACPVAFGHQWGGFTLSAETAASICKGSFVAMVVQGLSLGALNAPASPASQL